MCLPSARKLAPVRHILGIYREYVALAPRLFDNTRFTDHPSWTYNGIMATTPSGSRITVELGKCGGRPCIRHMRIRVKDVLEMLASGASEDLILADYPDLEREDIRACLEYAAQYFDHPVFLGG